MNRCRWCSVEVFFSTFRDCPGAGWEPDYDPNEDVEVWRHRGGYAACGWNGPSRFATRRPTIVTLCGSTRFWQTFQEQSLRLTLEGVIVLSVGCATASDEDHGITPEQKTFLDELHKQKIDLGDEILVLNVDGYIGDSTSSEIAYAEATGVPVSYLEPIAPVTVSA